MQPGILRGDVHAFHQIHFKKMRSFDIWITSNCQQLTSVFSTTVNNRLVKLWKIVCGQLDQCDLLSKYEFLLHY